MKLIKLVNLIILIIISWVGFSQNNVRIKLKINLIPVEERNGHLKNCQVKILEIILNYKVTVCQTAR